jgi:hypothetical protein
MNSARRMSPQAIALIVGGTLVGGYWWSQKRRQQNVHAESTLISKGGDNVPGKQQSMTSRIGEDMASMIQSFPPLKQFDTHLSTIKCYGNNLKRQVPVHEYVMHVNDEVMQCLIMDSDRSDAKLIGVEYIISDRLYQQLPSDEKKLWYSKGYEMKSGALVAPRMPMSMEHKLMSDLAPTYAKSVALWQVDKDRLPLGLPQFMISPNREGLLDSNVLRQRDRSLGIDSEAERKNRSDIKVPATSVDSWAKGVELTAKYL